MVQQFAGIENIPVWPLGMVELFKVVIRDEKNDKLIHLKNNI